MSETLSNAKTYFAVQIERYEHTAEVSKLVLSTADKLGVRFARLESMDTISVGTAAYLRFRSDAEDVGAVLDALAGQGRGIIRIEGSRYMVRNNGRSGLIPASRMLSVPCRTDQQRVYLGTSNKQWMGQFELD